MFGREFSNGQDLQGFLGQFRSADDLITKLADPSRFLFDSDSSETLAKQFDRYMQDTQSKVLPMAGFSVAETVYNAFVGRMMQTNDLLLRSDRYRGSPLIDAATSWQYLLWKYESESV
jgi:hypothetical protein